MEIIDLGTEEENAAFSLYLAVRDDFPALAPESFREALARNLRRGSVLGAVDADTLAGLLIYSPVLKRIAFLAVRPACRRRGIGRALTREAIARLGGEAELFTYAPQDGRGTPALSLYRALGFRERERADGYTVPVIRMVYEGERP